MSTKLGELLKKARESRGLSQEDVVSRLRLKLQIIQDIEANNYENISALVYMRGYLRSYSRLLGLNEDEILNAFSQLQIVDPIKSMHDPRLSQLTNHDEIIETSYPWLRWGLMGLLGLLVIAALLVWWNQTESSGKTMVSKKAPAESTASIALPTNPDAETPPVSAALAPAPAAIEGSKVETPEKPHKTAAHHTKPVHRSHKVAHVDLKPNYTLSPIKDPEIN